MLILRKTEMPSPYSGFTLVELAIVMVIIGLLIGGVLKGQELISTSRVNATISQLKSIDGAMVTFIDKYQLPPGDILTPSFRFPNCNTAPCNTGGDGNGRLNNPPAGSTAGTESERFFIHLHAADMIGGINPGQPADVWGNFYPATKIPGGGINTGFSVGGAAGDFGSELVDSTGMQSGFYFNIYGNRPYSGTEFMEVVNARMIDTKMDDGVPSRGSVRAKVTAGQPCASAGGGGEYLVTASNAVCGLFVRFQR